MAWPKAPTPGKSSFYLLSAHHSVELSYAQAVEKSEMNLTSALSKSSTDLIHSNSHPSFFIELARLPDQLMSLVTYEYSLTHLLTLPAP